MRRAMEVLLSRTRPAQLQFTTTFLTPSVRPSNGAVSSGRLNFSSQQSPKSVIYQRRTFLTTPLAQQQAAARRRADEDEDDNNNVPSQSRHPQQRTTADMATSAPREPAQRTTIRPSYLRERTPATSTKRQDPLNFLMRKGTGSGAQQSQSALGSSTSAGQPIQTDRSTANDFLEQHKDDLDLSFLRQPRRAQEGNPRQQQAQGSSPSGSAGAGSSVQDLLNSLRTRAGPTNSMYPARSSGGTGRPSGGSTTGAINTADMLSPRRPESYANQGSSLPNYLIPTVRASVADLAAPSFRPSPSLGRTQAVDANRGMDVARAFRAVEIRCAVNGVRQDVNKQRFHERPGMKRKRLVMSRWRRRFKEAFRATVRRVEDMRRKGW